MINKSNHLVWNVIRPGRMTFQTTNHWAFTILCCSLDTHKNWENLRGLFTNRSCMETFSFRALACTDHLHVWGPARGVSQVACRNFKMSRVGVLSRLHNTVGNLATYIWLRQSFVAISFERCRYFLTHVACRNLPWQGLMYVSVVATWTKKNLNKLIKQNKVSFDFVWAVSAVISKIQSWVHRPEITCPS